MMFPGGYKVRLNVKTNHQQYQHIFLKVQEFSDNFFWHLYLILVYIVWLQENTIRVSCQPLNSNCFVPCKINHLFILGKNCLSCDCGILWGLSELRSGAIVYRHAIGLLLDLKLVFTNITKELEHADMCTTQTIPTAGYFILRE